MPAARVPLGLAAGLALFTLLPFVGSHVTLRWTFLGAALFIAAWHAIVVTRAAALGRALRFDVMVRRPHWVQPLAQGSVYLYWGWYWQEVYPYFPFIAAQLLFLYAFDMLLSWSRRDHYLLGFGPFPIIFSTNLFMWFRPEWYFLQFAMVAVGSLGKEFVRWRRDGQNTHIVNPSAFSLSVCSLLLLLTGMTGLTWGMEIAGTQQTPPYIYHWLFLVGFVGGSLFRVTTMTMSAATALVLINAAYTAVTGTYYFRDTSIPAAVFLGMHLLFTDPSTSPRTDLGRVIFGTLYGASVFLLFVLLDALGQPTFYDKLLAVPLLNLSVQVIDRFASGRGRWADLGLPLTPAARNAIYLGCWVPIFSAMLATRAIGQEHEGQRPEFWERACTEKRPRGCYSLVLVRGDRCVTGDASSCNELGILFAEGRLIPANQTTALASFDRACTLGFGASCANARELRGGGRALSRDDTEAVTFTETRGGPLGSGCDGRNPEACTGLGLMYLEGREGPVDLSKAAAALRRGCALGQPVACANLGLMHRRGAGMPVNEQQARTLLDEACRRGVEAACRQ